MVEKERKIPRMDRRLVKTKRAVQGALMELLTEKELGEITITELAERADINRKTFYMHYSSLQEVLDEMETDIALRLEERFRHHPMRVGEDEVRSFFNEVNEMLMENISLYRRLVKARSANLLTVQAKDMLKKTLMRLVRDEIPKGNWPQIELALEYIAAGGMSMYVEWVADDQGLSLDDLTELAVTITMGMIDRLRAKYL